MPTNSPGIFIVLEGSDGSGKKTQFDLLKKKLVSRGYDVEVFDFPRYDKPSSHFVTKYLNGAYGPASGISPYTASLFFALDRFEAGMEIKKALDDGKIVLSNRYVGSNMAHQGAKFSGDIEKRSFFVWEDSLEFQLLGIPRPSINIFLRVTPEISYELIKQKAARGYTSKSHDEHESDIEHLSSAVQTYDLLCELFPKDYKAVDCVDNGKLLDIESISARVWEIVDQFMPALSREELVEDSNEIKPTSPKVNPAINTNDDNLDSIKWDIDKLSLAAAAELIGLGVNLKIDTGECWSASGKKYHYFIPEDLSTEARKNYKTTYEKAITRYKDISSKLFDYLSSAKIKNSDFTLSALMQRTLPMAAQFPVSVNIEATAATDLLAKLKSHSYPELQALAGDLLPLVQKSWPKLDHKTSSLGNDAAPEQLNQIMEQLSLNKLPQMLSGEQGVKMIDAHPRNEFDLLADSMYSFSDLTRDEILRAIDSWTYQQKSLTLRNALNIRESILEMPMYKFDGVADRISIIEFINLLGSSKFQLQQPTVRYGYDVLEIIEEANVEELYMEHYDSFLELFNALQKDLNDNNLNYCMLAGHKLRWQCSFTARDIKILKVSLPGDSHKILLDQIVEGIAEVHPIIGDHLMRTSAPRKQTNPTKNRPKNRRRKR